MLAGATADAPFIADVGEPPRFGSVGCDAEFIRAAGIPAAGEGANAGLAIAEVDRAGIGVLASLAAGADFAACAGGTFLGGVVVVVVAVCAAPAKQAVRATVPIMKAN